MRALSTLLQEFVPPGNSRKRSGIVIGSQLTFIMDNPLIRLPIFTTKNKDKIAIIKNKKDGDGI